MRVLSLSAIIFIILHMCSFESAFSTSQLIKRMIITTKVQKVVIKLDHSLILHPDEDMEADIYEDQNVIFEVEGEPQVIGLTEKLNNMQSQINEIRDELKKLDAINKRQDKIVLFNKYTCALLYANGELRLDQNQSINDEVRDELFNLGKYHNINYISHYIYSSDHPSVKQYKLQILTEKWLSMPQSIRQEFDIVYSSGFYEEIKRILLISTSSTTSCMYPISSDGMTQSLPPEEVAIEIKRIERWWRR